MPLNHTGLVNMGIKIERELEKKITAAFSIIDEQVADIAKERELHRKHVKMLQPLHCLVLVTENSVIVVLSVSVIGTMVVHQYQYWKDGPMNLPTAKFLVERDLNFENPFGFEIPLSVLDYDVEENKIALTKIAQQYMDWEQENFERMNRLVRLNPIFETREFFLNEDLVFVLSPFGDPFDTIFTDHIKPTIEGIQKFDCLRADDIYDNQPIIEDIWQHINEARLILAELSGRNANVFYEAGIAHTVGKEVILITQSMDDVPFDLRHLRCIVYDYTPKGIMNLEKNLINTVMHILSKR